MKLIKVIPIGLIASLAIAGSAVAIPHKPLTNTNAALHVTCAKNNEAKFLAAWKKVEDAFRLQAKIAPEPNKTYLLYNATVADFWQKVIVAVCAGYRLTK